MNILENIVSTFIEEVLKKPAKKKTKTAKQLKAFAAKKAWKKLKAMKNSPAKKALLLRLINARHGQ